MSTKTIRKHSQIRKESKLEIIVIILHLEPIEFDSISCRQNKLIS